MRDDLPRGTVTFLFTDVAGSTRLLRELGQEAYAAELAAHRAVIRSAATAESGVEVDTQGDAFFLAFPTADGAVRAASAITSGLAGGPIHVRAGIHTGTPLVVEEGYVGDDVHLAARIAAAGHGGQTLVSGTTHGLLGSAAVDLVDLGDHRLKDFATPIRIHQVGSASFPPLRSIANTNLPTPISSFLGRADDVAAVADRIVAGDRLVTLTGPGGIGKTRLSIEVARRVTDRFAAGVWWVELATIRDPELVLPTMAAAIGTDDDLVQHIGPREMLLVLDNLEQVADVAPALARLLQDCPRLAILATSRVTLHLTGEREVRIGPLDDDVAVRLFVERSGLDAGPDVEQVCRRLDAMPLAVELAASRARTLGIRTVLDRLGSRLDLLKGGRDLDPRQQTLRATIAWSDDLLDEEARQLFRGLATFAGGCTLDAAEQVLDADIDVLDRLIAHSLVRVTDGRFWMLETIRAFAVDAFAEDPRRPAIEAAFAAWALDLVVRDDALVRGPEQLAALARLDAEIDNVRAAFELFMATGATDDARRLATAARWWLRRRGFGIEVLDWLTRVIAMPGGDPALLGWCLIAGAPVDEAGGSIDDAMVMLERARSIGESVGDRRMVASALELRGYIDQGADGVSMMEEAAAIFAELGLDDEGGRVVIDLAARALNDGDDDRAMTLAVEGIARARALGNRHGIGVSAGNSAAALALSGRMREAEAAIRVGAVVFEELGERTGFIFLLEVAAIVEATERPGRKAASMLGAVEAGFEGFGGALERSDERMRAAADAALEAMDPAERDAAIATGRKQRARDVLITWLAEREPGR